MFLAAAGKYFHENGVNFVILEANDYLGGRVRKTTFDNKTFELGAQWVHVPGQNHIMEKKAIEYNLTYYLDVMDITKNFVFR